MAKRWLTINASSGQVFKQVANRSLVLNDSFSVSLFNESGLQSDADCLSWCSERGCAVAVVNKTSRLCLMAVINDESSGEQGPNGSHVTRYLGSPGDTAVRVWTAEDFELQLRNRIFQRVLRNSSTGRNGTVQALTVNFAGCYRIEAFGAAGGKTILSVPFDYKGAFASGCFSLAAGTRLEIVVGQAGGNSECAFGAGGGGGSFVYVSNGTGSPQLLVAAGGGGGTSLNIPGRSGSNSASGTDSYPAGSYSGIGGAGGQPGRVAPNRHSSHPDDSSGGPGAGWSASAQPSNESFVDPGGPGRSLDDGWLGGARYGSCPTGDGGFGGGGAGGGCCTGVRYGAGGGGGGFSGGGAGTDAYQAGGGGGSFCSGFGCATSSGANAEQQGRVRLSACACE